MLTDCLMWATLAVGALCVSLSAALSVFFARSHRRLGTSMACMLAAEALMGGVTVGFTLWDALMDVPIPEPLAIVLRLVIFAAAASSSVHLSVSIHKVLHDPGD